MDRPLEQRVLNRRRTRRIAGASAGVVALVLISALLPGWVRPSVRRSQIRTAIVGRGPLEATLTASGTIVPEREQVLSSPLDTRLLRVLVAPGSAVKRGDPIVLLDVNEARLTLEKLDDQIALKSVEAQSESIVTRQNLADLEAQRGIRKLTVESGTITVERNQSMFEKGIATENELRASRTTLEAARLELKRIEDTVTYTQSASDARLRTVALECSILRKERDEANRQLELATARTDRDGVLTWALQNEGAAVRRGDVIARVADLSSFRVEAHVSDVHGTLLTAGMPARVAVGIRSLPSKYCGAARCLHSSVFSE